MTDETLLLRQVHPSWVQAGRITSQAFKPTPKDHKKLSVYDGEMISSDDSWSHFTEELGLDSIGVLGVTKAECDNEELDVKSDPEPFPEHVTINFEGYANPKIKTKAKKLRASAINRGWQYQPETGE